MVVVFLFIAMQEYPVVPQSSQLTWWKNAKWRW